MSMDQKNGGLFRFAVHGFHGTWTVNFHFFFFGQNGLTVVCLGPCLPFPESCCHNKEAWEGTRRILNAFYSLLFPAPTNAVMWAQKALKWLLSSLDSLPIVLDSSISGSQTAPTDQMCFPEKGDTLWANYMDQAHSPQTRPQSMGKIKLVSQPVPTPSPNSFSPIERHTPTVVCLHFIFSI